MKRIYLLMIIIIFALFLTITFCNVKAIAQEIETGKLISSSCHIMNECRGATKKECLQDWLTRSGCFSKDYIEKHFRNFRMGQKGTVQDERVHFDFLIDGNLVLSCGWLDDTGYAEFEGTPNNYRLVRYYGPLKEYELKISKEEAFKKAKEDKFCTMSGQSNILDFVNLEVRDEFDGTQMAFTGQGRFNFDPDGLCWKMPLPCGHQCSVDALSKTLIKKTTTCEH